MCPSPLTREQAEKASRRQAGEERHMENASAQVEAPLPLTYLCHGK